MLVWRMAMLTTSVSRLLHTIDQASLTCSGNWFGGEAISLAMEYTHSDEFRAAGYAPMMVDGTEYGEVRQYGNFSFARVYEAGHEIPYYQRKSSCYTHFSQSGQMTGFAN